MTSEQKFEEALHFYRYHVHGGNADAVAGAANMNCGEGCSIFDAVRAAHTETVEEARLGGRREAEARCLDHVPAAQREGYERGLHEGTRRHEEARMAGYREGVNSQPDVQKAHDDAKRAFEEAHKIFGCTESKKAEAALAALRKKAHILDCVCLVGENSGVIDGRCAALRQDVNDAQ